jgi:hypothetical protein
MAEQKTLPTDVNVPDFLQEHVEDAQRRTDAFALLEIMQTATGYPPVLWAGNLIGFGHYHYKYASGHEGDSFLAGFAARKSNLTVYLMGAAEQFSDLLSRLGKYKLSGSCLHIKKLADVDTAVLGELVYQSATRLREMYPA